MASKIVWGIIGCGDVAEVKSGPAFSLIPNSKLKAVMRRNLDKAKDFALRHNVPHYYNTVQPILNDPEINAVYIATPPASHLDYALQAIKAGKHVYLEKPMTLNTEQSQQLCNAVKVSGTKLTVAHYRRKLPAFLKVKELLDGKCIGDVLFADIQVLQPPKSHLVAQSELPWRFNAAIAGGGLFHDLAPHQLDLMYLFFGEYNRSYGVSDTQNKASKVDDLVNGIIQFKNGVQCRGIWSFNCADVSKTDRCVIYGTEGQIEFSFFGNYVHLKTVEQTHQFTFSNPKHIQHPMITAVVDYFSGKQDVNPCAAYEALIVSQLMDAFCVN